MADINTTIETLLDQALALDPKDLADFLDRHCGSDAVLRSRLEEALQAADDPNYCAPLTRLPGSDDLVGQTIDRYTIKSVIGEGGMGVVYLAEQQRPIFRQVALKIIKLGMDTKRFIARFEMERQALASMNHPCIARILDAESMPAGRPYIVMEYVIGAPIAEFCDAHRLTIERRLRLFMDVCHAIQHAHQKGIIHRDIKPSNVIVSLVDGKPVPKVIDFGVSKLFEDGQGEEAVVTRHGEFLGTPEYMSPEQAGGSLDVDTRTDVYSLGVLLYELLTGHRPFEKRQLREAGLAEIQRFSFPVDPPTPSTRLNNLGAMATSVANNRRTEPRFLIRQVRGDLDWIVMKCLKSERTHRYETANALANEVQRFLNCEPIMAGSPGALYRSRRFIRRHSVGVAAGMIVTLALAGGLAGIIIMYLRAENARAEALADRDRADQAALAYQQEAQRSEAMSAAERLHREQAERALRETEYQSFLANIRAAEKALQHNDVPGLRTHLNAIPPHFRNWEWRYLDLSSDESDLTVRSAPAPVTNILFTRDGAHLLTSSGAVATMWDVQTGGKAQTARVEPSLLEKITFLPHRPSLQFMFNSDASWFVGESPGGTIRQVDFLTGKSIHTLIKPFWCTDIQVSPDDAIILTTENIPINQQYEVNVWNSGNGRPLGKLVHKDVIDRASFSPDGTRVVLVGGKTAIVWEMATLTKQFTLEESSFVTTALYSPDGNWVITGCRDGSVRQWNASNGSIFMSFLGHTNAIQSAIISPDGRRALTASADDTARVWDVATGVAIATLVGHEDDVIQAIFDGSGQKVLTASSDCTARLWEIKTSKELMAFRGHAEAVTRAVFSPDSSIIATCSTDGTAKLWKDATARRSMTELAQVGGPVDAHFSSDGNYFVTYTTSGIGEARLWDLRKINESNVLVENAVVRCATFSPDGRFVAIGTEDGDTSIWNVKDCNKLRTLHDREGGITALAFSFDGRRLATGARGGSIKIWDTMSEVPLQSLHMGMGDHWVSSLAFTIKDNRLLLAAASAGRVTLWDIDRGRAVAQLAKDWIARLNYAYDCCAKLSPDESVAITHGLGKVRLWDLATNEGRDLGESESWRTMVLDSQSNRILLVSKSNLLTVYDLASGLRLFEFREHKGDINVATYSPDGTRIVTGSTDGTIKVWDASNGAELVTLGKHSSSIRTATFSPNGAFLLTSSNDGRIVIWKSVHF